MPLLPTITLAAPWVVDHQDAESVVLRVGDSARGVRVDWLAGEHAVGVTLIEKGRTLTIADAGKRWPLLAPAWPTQEVHTVEILAEGPDLVVRFGGPPFRSLTVDTAATSDPALCWVRIRPRPDDWKVVAKGLCEVSLPAQGLRVAPHDTEGTLLHSALGTVSYSHDAPAVATTLGPERWKATTWPSLAVHEPYRDQTLTLEP